MLKLNKVEYGFYPYAGAQGMQMFHYDFIVDEEKVEDEVEATKNLLKDLADKVEALDRKDEFNASLLGKCYTIFTFDHIDHLFDDINNLMWQCFYTNMTKLSYDAQYASAGGISSNMNAWPVGLITTPTYYSGKEEFYQYFNLLLCKLSPKEGEDYSPFAFNEMTKNPCLHISCECATPEDVENFVNNFANKEEFIVPFSRVNILVRPENVEKVSPVVEEAGLRLCIAFPKGIGMDI